MNRNKDRVKSHRPTPDSALHKKMLNAINFVPEF